MSVLVSCAMISRRKFLSRSTSVAAGALSIPTIAHSAAALNQKPGQTPRHIIQFVADGMSWGTLTCGDLYSRLFRKRPLSWITLGERPDAKLGMVNMRSLNSMVTDSAAAASSWGCGSRVFNGAINTLPNGKRLTPICSLLGEAGWTRALVTTTEITHATPAGFAANSFSRDQSQLIAAQYLDRQIEVLLGGGKPLFDPNKRRDKRDLKGAYALAGYTVVENYEQLRAAPVGKRLLGLFADGHLPYSIDRAADPKIAAQVPPLAEMTKAALARIGGSSHFFMMVEGGRVDHGAHNSDAAAALQDLVAMDEALEVCLDFQKENPDTLIVITTDHGNSNLALNGMGGGYSRSSAQFANLGLVRASLPEIIGKIKARGHKVPITEPKEIEKSEPAPYPTPAAEFTYDDEQTQNRLEDAAKKTPAAKTRPTGYEVHPKAIMEVVEQYTGYRLPKERAELFRNFLLRRGKTMYDQMNSETTQFGQLMANRLGIGWTGNSHTADYVPLVAVGPGAERFAGFVQNTQIFTHYTELAGINFKNPEMPLFAANGDMAEDTEEIAAYLEPSTDNWA